MRCVPFVVIMQACARYAIGRSWRVIRMKYMMIIAGAEDAWSHLSDAEQAALYAEIGSWWGSHSATGEILDGYELQPPSTATTVRRSQDGQVTVTDGPFVESKEMIAGYGILEVPDLDAAIRLASTWPAPDVLEIRPIVDSPAGAAEG